MLSSQSKKSGTHRIIMDYTEGKENMTSWGIKMYGVRAVVKARISVT